MTLRLLIFALLLLPLLIARAAPANDHYASAIDLSGTPLPLTITDSNVAATEQAGELLDGQMLKTVWYRWVPTFDGEVEIHTAGAGFDTILAAYRQTPGLPPLHYRYAWNDDGAGLTSRIALDVEIGRPIAIQVGGFQGTSGTFPLTIAIPTPPANDNYAAFTDLGEGGLPVSLYGTNVGATFEEEAGELLTQAFGTVWYRWQSTISGLVEIRTTGADFNTELIAFNVTDGLPRDENILARNEKESPALRSSFITFGVTPGQVIAIRVGGVEGLFGGGTRGTFPLSIAAGPPPPAHDNYANRLNLSGLGNTVPQEVPGSNFGATIEPGEAQPSFDHTGSVWYEWTAPLAGDYTFAADTASFDSAVRIYEAADSLATLGRHVAGNDDIGLTITSDRSGRASFRVTAGRKYAIQVFGFGSGVSGAFTLRITRSVRAQARFDDVDVDRLSGQGGGFGWTGLWHYDPANTSASNPFNPSEEGTSLGSLCLFGGLEYLRPGSETFVEVNAAPAGHVFSLTRDLAVPEGQDGTIRYFSFLIRPTSPAGSFCGVRLRTASGPMLYMGRPGAGTTGDYVLEDVGGGSQHSFGLPGYFTAHQGKAVRVVVRAVFGPVDEFRLYMDPSPGESEAGTLSIVKSGNFSDITGVGLYSNAAFEVDDIRVTDSWESAMTPAYDSDLIINEIASFPVFDANGDGTAQSGEDTFVEIVNRSPRAVDLTGLTLYDSHLQDARAAHVFPQGTTLQPGAALVIFGGGGVTEGTTAAFGNAWVQRANAPSGFGVPDFQRHTLRGPANRGCPFVASSLRFTSNNEGLRASVRTPELSDSPLADTFLRHTEVYPGITHSPGTYGEGTPFAGATTGLTLSISRGSVVEGSAPGTATLTVSRPAPFDEALSVVLRSDDSTEADVFPGYVVIPAGEAHATLPISAFQDYLADGHQTVTITGMTSRLFNASSTLTVLDNDRHIFINEIDAQSNGGGGGLEFGEFIELYDGGLGFKSLHDFIVVLFDADAPDDGAYRVIDLQGRQTSFTGFFVIDSNAFPELTPGWLTNGGGAVAIYRKRTGDGMGGGAAMPPYYDFPPGTAPVGNALLVDAIHHVTHDEPDPALVALFTPGGVQADEGPLPGGDPGQMNLTTSRCPDAQSPLNSGAFRMALPTPGSSNLTYPGFNTWASTRGITSLTDDDDHDGLDNLLEYALGGIPADLTGDTDTNSQQLLPGPLENPFGELRMQFYKGPQAGFDPRLRWVIEASTDLIHWSTRDMVIIYEDCGSLTASYIGNTPRVQLRLRVEQTP